MTLTVQADEQTLRYYRSRAAEYDETSYGAADAGEGGELAGLVETLRELEPARTLDVGCGTGFLTRESRRVAAELVIVDCAWQPGLVEEGREERFLRDGSRFLIHKCYFRAEMLLAELDGGEVCFRGETFVAVRRVWSTE